MKSTGWIQGGGLFRPLFISVLKDSATVPGDLSRGLLALGIAEANIGRFWANVRPKMESELMQHVTRATEGPSISTL